MTALEKYIRLEATGDWHETPGQPGREVLVSFGNATLTLSDFSDAPLEHWSLAAIRVVATADGVVTYAPGRDVPDRLTIRDTDMIEAIDIVTTEARAQAQTAPTQRKIGRTLAITLLAGLILFLLWKAPEFLHQQAVRLVPPEKALLVGEDVFAAMDLNTCESPSGREGRNALSAALHLPKDSIRIVAESRPTLARLPGKRLIVSQQALREAASPAELAGRLKALLTSVKAPVLTTMIRNKSLPQTLAFLSHGDISADDIHWMADWLALSSNSHIPPETVDLTLSDQDWVALQEICSD